MTITSSQNISRTQYHYFNNGTPLTDGPSLAVFGPSQYFVLLGDPLSLVCGADLDTNPQATITWTADGTTIVVDSPRYSVDNGPEVVRLNFTQTFLSDAGMWRCDIRTESDQYIISNGSLVPMNSTVIGVTIQHDVELIIVGECVHNIISHHNGIFNFSHSPSWSATHTLCQRE